MQDNHIQWLTSSEYQLSRRTHYQPGLIRNGSDSKEIAEPTFWKADDDNIGVKCAGYVAQTAGSDRWYWCPQDTGHLVNHLFTASFNTVCIQL